MKTGNEGQVCSECGIYIPSGGDAVMAGGGRVLCAECTRKDAKKQASKSGVGSQLHCHKCRAVIAEGAMVCFDSAGKMLCEECARVAGISVEARESKGPHGQQLGGTPTWQHGAAEVLYSLLVVMAVLSGLAAIVGGMLLLPSPGSPSAPYIIASGVVGCLLWSWMAAVLRVLLDIHKRMPAA
jgi:hypothetical protein